MYATKFLASFLSLMLLTYVWRLVFVTAAFEPTADVKQLQILTNGFLLLTYIGLIYVTYQRGKAISKTYLPLFPLISAVFDLVIVSVLFIPTAINITTLIIGVSHKIQSETDESKPSESS